MLMSNMRLQTLRQVDLNLFVTFAVIAEEKSITAAAAKLHLSQPAVSRALKRARLMFQDDLLVRSPNGFELTLRGRKLLDELNQLLPNMERLVVPNVFNPAREPNTFRLSGPDNVCSALLPHVLRNCMKPEFVICLDVLSWQLGTADMLEHGQLDMAFQIDDGLLPSHLLSERLYREEWICAVARDSGFGDRLTLKQYLEAEHLVVSTLTNVQNIPDKQLAAIGKKRKSRIRLSYFNVALHCLPGSSLVLTLTSGMRSIAKSNPHLRIVRAPSELQGFHILMVWHPRVNTDPRHEWLRGIVRTAAEALGS
jgi:DNA-binding transcriptional LysR family regulator